MRRIYFNLKWIFIVVIIYGVWECTLAQSLKPLDHDAYEIWDEITESAISSDGEWAMYSLVPENGDAELRLKGLASEQIYSIARGDSSQFSYDSRFAVFLIRPTKEQIRKAKLEKENKSGNSSGEKAVKDTLCIIRLSNGQLISIPRVMSYKMPEKSGGWVAYRLEQPLPEKDDTTAVDTMKEVERKENKQEKNDKKKKPEGTELVLHNLASGNERHYKNVVSYHFSKDGRWMVFTRSSADSSADGIYAVVLATGELISVMTGPGEYLQATFDEAGNYVAFLSNRDDFGSEQPEFILYHWPIESKAPKAIAKTGNEGIPPGWWVSEHGGLSFSKDGKRLFFGIAPRPPEEVDKEYAISDSLPKDERVVLDVWQWKDSYIQPMQLERLEKEEKRTYLAVADPEKKRIVRLATEDMPEINPGDEGNADVALGITNRPYRRLISWDWPEYYDYYIVDIKTGHRRKVLDKVQAKAELSPKANYITWWNREDSSWYALNIKDGKRVNLSVNIPAPVYDERHDWAYPADPYGSAGWTNDDKKFVLYDRYDLWAIDPSGKNPPRNITNGVGRKNNLRFRYIQLDPEERSIDPAAPMLLSAFNLNTKADGFYRDKIEGNEPPARLVMMDRAFSKPEKAREADRYLFTRSSFVEFPDLWNSGPDFNDMQKISTANPQQSEYRWGTAELVEWTSLNGDSLEGILYKPDTFDPGKTYPMMVYFYERTSNKLHRHWAPKPHRSIINFTFYVSRGYLVFVPDIHYEIGYPGESALNCVLPGVTHLIKQGFVDKENIGVQGHSWGGYQIAYLVTETNIFKAAEAGAPVANMISAYGGIRWESGMSRMFQYENTQSRIGGSLWEYPLRYIENSPVFFADKIETPLLIMHNDHDGAVPWYQGIELFVALRRLGKPAWLINYNDEPHWPLNYYKKKDWAIRMQQYFDHYLKGVPAPVWLEKGIPATKKGKTLGLELVSPEGAD